MDKKTVIEIEHLARESERLRWAVFIGDQLATEHPKHRAAFWGLAEMMMKNNMDNPKLQ